MDMDKKINNITVKIFVKRKKFPKNNERNNIFFEMGRIY